MLQLVFWCCACKLKPAQDEQSSSVKYEKQEDAVQLTRRKSKNKPAQDKDSSSTKCEKQEDVIQFTRKKQSSLENIQQTTSTTVLFVFFLLFPLALGNTVDLIYRPVQNNNYETQATINLNVYEGSAARFKMQPVSMRPIRFNVMLVKTECQYTHNVDYWFPDYIKYMRKDYTCCGTTVPRPLIKYRNAFRYSRCYVDCIGCLWNAAHCFCCGGGLHNSACYNVEECPFAAWARQSIGIAFQILDSRQSLRLSFDVESFHQELTITNAAAAYTSQYGLQLDVAAFSGLRCLPAGKYVYYDGVTYKYDYPNYGDSAAGQVSDVASKSTQDDIL